jgi:hypothetical protein
VVGYRASAERPDETNDRSWVPKKGRLVISLGDRSVESSKLDAPAVCSLKLFGFFKGSKDPPHARAPSRAPSWKQYGS